MTDPALLTEGEFIAYAKRCSVPLSRSTLYRLRREGKMPFYRLGQEVRYSENDLAVYLERCRKGR